MLCRCRRPVSYPPALSVGAVVVVGGTVVVVLTVVLVLVVVPELPLSLIHI